MFKPRHYSFNQTVSLPGMGQTLFAEAHEFTVTLSEHGYVFTKGAHATAVPHANIRYIVGSWDVELPTQTEPNVVPLKKKK